jgi:tripartite-type tricarboxylate transporter receptor subunit TctC
MAASDADWPKKPIVAILPFPAGGSTDIFARAIGVPLGEALGQPIVIENKPGAGGMIAMGASAKAAPDGYTLLFSALTNQSISQALFKNPPADLTKDFTSIALVGSIPHLIVVNPSVPAKNLPELIAYIKSKRETLITPLKVMAVSLTLSQQCSCRGLVPLVPISLIRVALLLSQI